MQLQHITDKMSKEKETKQIRKDQTIADAIKENPEMAEKMMNMGLGCAGCSFAYMETLEQGIAGHGMDVDKVMDELNDSSAVKDKENKDGKED